MAAAHQRTAPGAVAFMPEKALKGRARGDITTQEFNHLLSLAVHGSVHHAAPDNETIFGSPVRCMAMVPPKAVANLLKKWLENSNITAAGAGAGNNNNSSNSSSSDNKARRTSAGSPRVFSADALPRAFVEHSLAYNDDKASTVWMQLQRNDNLGSTNAAAEGAKVGDSSIAGSNSQFVLQVHKARDANGKVTVVPASTVAPPKDGGAAPRHTLLLAGRRATFFERTGRPGQFVVFSREGAALLFSVDARRGGAHNAAAVWGHVLSSVATGHSRYRLCVRSRGGGGGDGGVLWWRWWRC